MKYRAEIDGLRAVAVVPVVLFHAGIETLSGGFVGVDVFFVISGYLITSLILHEVAAGTFTIASFYERRARRILPALFVVMLACLPFAYLWMMPFELKEFGESLVSVAVFSSNFLFYRQSGYFEQAAELKPLLHTWSLSVEEQFYIFFPLFVLLLFKYARQHILLGFSICFGISLLLAQCGGNLELGWPFAGAAWSWQNLPSWGYYMLPARAWELLLGSIIAYHHVHGSRALSGDWAGDWAHIWDNKAIAQIGSLLGLLLISVAVFTFDRHTPFPSVYTLVPTLGAGLIIVFARHGTWVHGLLANRLMVGLGLVSYSFYLWHQPLFAFARLAGHGGHEAKWLLPALALVALGLAYLTWRYVEQPFRSRTLLQRPEIFRAALVATSVAASIGVAGQHWKGLQGHFPKEAHAIFAYQQDDYRKPASVRLYREGTCFLRPEQSRADIAPECAAAGGERSVFLWGDSHAAAMSFGLRQTLAQTDVSLTQYTASACPPVFDHDVARRPNCRGFNDWVRDRIRETRPKTLVLHANWHLNLAGELRLAHIAETLRQVKQLSPDTRVMIVGGVPQWHPDLPRMLARRLLDGAAIDGSLRIPSPQIPDIAAFDHHLEALARSNGASFTSLLAEVCNPLGCRAAYAADGRFEPAAWDYGHLTEAGSRSIGQLVHSRLLGQLGMAP